VDRWGDAQAARELGLEFAPLEEAIRESVGVHSATREPVEELPVAALGGSEVGEEVCDLLIFDHLQEPSEPLAAPRLDESAEEKTIDLRPGIAARNDPIPQALSPAILPPSPERPAPLPQDRDHPPEVLHLFSRESRGALDELGVVRVVTGERKSVDRDLLLADRVIGEELRQVRRGELRPGARRLMEERKCGEDLLEADRLGKVAVSASRASHKGRIILPT
jgi:hypothetical protein